ncbi:PHP domain-containing protein [Kallotenue papyrolyticum]|uniref:PHP domain-containing protein n=1 Tax=Kallotenue papyrolyticum TaxID=1325125 RepID=UPI0004BC050B|nr:PHP domain-containing protein [Kallotenue papyrolyticum]
MLVDLHIHTNATPHHASWEPETLVRAARTQGIGVIAVTDHNCVRQVRATMVAGAAQGVRVIPAVELDTAFGTKLWHLLIYGVAPETPALVELCAAVEQRNAHDAQELIAYFEAQGRPLPWLETLERRPTVADVGRALVEAGIVPRRADLDAESTGTGWIMTHLRQFYRPVTVDEAIAVAHVHGGVAVLAHPGRSKGVYAMPATADDIAAMVAVGLDGIEVFYPTHTPEQQRFYQAQAAQYGLLVTAGSDSHHPAHGLVGRSAHACAAFLERMGIAV